MDAGLLHFLGLHRFWSVHAHLVCEHAGGDTILHHEKHAIVVGAEHAAGGWPVLYTVSNFAYAFDQDASAPAFCSRRLDGRNANARHLPRRPAELTRHRISPQHLGFAFAHCHRRNACVRLPATCPEDFIVSRARPASDRISTNSKLKWPTRNPFARLRIPARRCPHGWELCFSSRWSASWCSQ